MFLFLGSFGTQEPFRNFCEGLKRAQNINTKERCIVSNNVNLSPKFWFLFTFGKKCFETHLCQLSFSYILSSQCQIVTGLVSSNIEMHNTIGLSCIICGPIVILLTFSQSNKDGGCLFEILLEHDTCAGHGSTVSINI